MRSWVIVALAVLGALGFVMVPSKSAAQVSWSPQAFLNSDAPTDTSDDVDPQIMTDKKGTWITVWSASGNTSRGGGGDGDIIYSVSADNGAIWSLPVGLNTDWQSDIGTDVRPRIATDSTGTWITVWDTLFSIKTARSLDNGGTWTSPSVIGPPSGSTNQSADVATDGAGNWVTVWSSSFNSGGTTDTDILFSRSTNNGASWSAATALNTNAATDFGADNAPRIVAGGANVFIAFWTSYENLNGLTGTEGDILFSRSTNGGVTWSDPAPLNTNAATDSLEDINVAAATDGEGHWNVFWQTTTGASSSDVYASHSTDNGVTWGDPVLMQSAARQPTITTDVHGNWIAAFIERISNQDGAFFRQSIDNGFSWTAASQFINATTNVSFAQDGAGTWLAASGWFACTSPSGSCTGVDYEIVDSAAVIPSADADLSVVNIHSPSNPIGTGGTVNIALTVTNNGPAAAHGIIVTDSQPTPVLFNNVSTSVGSASLSTGTMTAFIDSLQVGAQAFININATAPSDGVYSHSAFVSAIERDPNLVNNMGQDTIIVVPEPDLVLTQHNPVLANLGTTITYTLHVVNSGTAGATGIVLTDVLPASVSYLSASSTKGTVVQSPAGTVTADIGTLGTGESADVTIVVMANANGFATNNASVAENEKDTNPGNNSSSAQIRIVPVAAMDVAVSQSASANPTFTGEPLVYTILVPNNGPYLATEVVVTDTLPSGVTFNSATSTLGSISQSGGTVTANINALTEITTATITITVTPNSKGTLTNSVSVTGTETDLDPTNNSSSLSVTAQLPPTADLTGKWSSLVQSIRNVRGGVKTTLKGKLVAMNGGQLAAPASTATYYLSTNSTLETDTDTPLAASTVFSLQPGKTARLMLNVTLPSGVSASGKYVIALLDSGEVVSEQNKNNNILVFGPVPF